MMAVIYILGALQVLSTIVNLLALGAFWVTPGLRTTANKFVINLLFVNIIGCLAVTPALWLDGAATSSSSDTLQSLPSAYHRHYRETILSAHAMPLISHSTPSELNNEIRQNVSDDQRATASAMANKSVPSESAAAAASERQQQQHSEAAGVATASGASARNGCAHNGAGDKSNCDDTINEYQDNNNIYPDDMAGISIGHVIESDKFADDMRDVGAEETLAIFGGKPTGTGPTVRPENESASHRRMRYWSRFDGVACQHFWGLDLAAALGGLSVLLVVGDTWCAVTDPLRYHARISPVKSWLLIGSNWFIGILFGIGSIFRHDACQPRSQPQRHWRPELRTPVDMAADSSHLGRGNNDASPALHMFNVYYDLLYTWSFLVVIVLIPLCIICFMYWNIFWEARQSGQRMRKNGSSPLLQSALNLATAPPQLPAINGALPPSHGLANGQALLGVDNRRRHTVDATHCIQINVSEFKNLQHQSCTDAEDSDTESNQSQYLQIPSCLAAHHQPASSLQSQSNILHEDERDGQQPARVSARKYDRHGAQFASHLTIEECSELLPQVHGRHGRKSVLMAANQPTEFRYVHSSPNLEKLDRLADGDYKPISSSCHSSIHEFPSCRASSSTRTSSTSSASTTHSGTTTKALSYMSSLRHRLSNASSIFKYREESRAARISILVIIIFLMSYFPYGLLGLVHLRIDAMPVPQMTTIEMSLLLIANIGFPIIFAHRNKRVRRGVCRLFGIDTRKNARLQVRHHHHLNNYNNNNNNMHSHTQSNNKYNNNFNNNQPGNSHSKSGDFDCDTPKSCPIVECEANDKVIKCHHAQDDSQNHRPPKIAE